MTPERPTKKEIRYAAIMILVIFASHVTALFVFGATFWIDSLAYVSLGDALFDPHKLKIFYDGVGRWSFSHLGVGLPFVWSITKLFPVSWRWPVLAVFQHSFAIYSCWLAFAWAIRPAFPSLCGVFLLSLLPFYESGHQMLMTESLSASLLLIAVALTVRLTTTSWSVPIFWGLLATLFAVTQIRSYFGLMVAALAAVALLWTGKWRSGRAILLIAVFGMAILVFPAYRFSIIGDFFMPSFGSNTLICSLWADPKPSTKLVPIFEHADLPLDYSASDVLTKGLDYNDTVRVAQHWREKGLTDAQINHRANYLAGLLFRDGIRPTINRILYGLNSSGFLFPYTLGSAAYEVFRGKNMDAEWKHQVEYYRWFSWTDSGDYQNSFNQFFRTPQPHIPSWLMAQQEMIATFEPYVEVKFRQLRDPLLLGRVSIDVWSSLGIVGVIILCLRRNFKLAILLIIPVAINFATTAAAAIPNVRYAYALVPIYFFAGVVGLETLLSKPASKPRLPISEKPDPSGSTG